MLFGAKTNSFTSLVFSVGIRPIFLIIVVALSREGLTNIFCKLVAVGILWPWLARVGVGRLPGDILIDRENFTIYIPIATGLLFSIVLSVMLWLINR